MRVKYIKKTINNLDIKIEDPTLNSNKPNHLKTSV